MCSNFRTLNFNKLDRFSLIHLGDLHKSYTYKFALLVQC